MTNQRHVNYRGCSITTRWIEVVPPSDWVELEPLRRWLKKRFTASFSVAADVACGESWQQFSVIEFDSSASASDNAMTDAQRMIDARLAERPRQSSALIPAHRA